LCFLVGHFGFVLVFLVLHCLFWFLVLFFGFTLSFFVFGSCFFWFCIVFVSVCNSSLVLAFVWFRRSLILKLSTSCRRGAPFLFASLILKMSMSSRRGAHFFEKRSPGLGGSLILCGARILKHRSWGGGDHIYVCIYIHIYCLCMYIYCAYVYIAYIYTVGDHVFVPDLWHPWVSYFGRMTFRGSLTAYTCAPTHLRGKFVRIENRTDPGRAWS